MRTIAALAVIAVPAGSGAAAAEPPRDADERMGGISIDFATVDIANGVLTIEGRNFAEIEDVVLGGQSLADCTIYDTFIDCLVDPEALAEGSYDLELRGGARRHRIDDLTLAVGAVGPVGPEGASGPQGEQGLQGPRGEQGPAGPSVLDLPEAVFTGRITAPRLEIQDTGWPSVRTVSAAAAGTWHQLVNTTAGGRNWSLISTGEGNGEGAGKLLVRDHTAFANRIVVDEAGRVGIGTNGPVARVEIQDSAWPSLRTVSSAVAGTWHQLVNTTVGGRNWSLISTGEGNGEGAGKLLIRDHTAFANRLVIDESGRVGIGTHQPGQALSVAGTIESTSGGIRFPDGSAQTSAVRLARNAITVVDSLDPGESVTVAAALQGVAPGDVVSVSPRSDLPVGIVVAWARAWGSHTCRFALLNTSGATVIVNAQFDLLAVKP